MGCRSISKSSVKTTNVFNLWGLGFLVFFLLLFYLQIVIDRHCAKHLGEGFCNKGVLLFLTWLTCFLHRIQQYIKITKKGRSHLKSHNLEMSIVINGIISFIDFFLFMHIYAYIFCINNITMPSVHSFSYNTTFYICSAR